MYVVEIGPDDEFDTGNGFEEGTRDGLENVTGYRAVCASVSA
jgi:hypothetical protein